MTRQIVVSLFLFPQLRLPSVLVAVATCFSQGRAQILYCFSTFSSRTLTAKIEDAHRLFRPSRLRQRKARHMARLSCISKRSEPRVQVVGDEFILGTARALALKIDPKDLSFSPGYHLLGIARDQITRFYGIELDFQANNDSDKGRSTTTASSPLTNVSSLSSRAR